ncbi:helix-turn-helix domain-containing protein [Polynucleobacter sp. MWH-Spelu-300-X4]|jgi:transcriptional regulator with XRE-family HTH domain|uniref:helix-turn-helix domain-containing protein n=1 Tax=Polynucleobacter sp. MWH-Spelu-300-X4 TaxID=2689109 RepID=UPI001BFE9BE1|nr:helix-turn-helix domain-containing protein [Polynucleobacter sp. MWH-Spelu-300-X4]QWD79478.1 helix-turn-helix domain-containing protein [Polynucleobacter sp. MWH-Spelu-300-X4]
MKNTIKTIPHVTQDLKELGSFLRIARKRRRLTMTEVADRLNLSYQTVTRIEKGDPSVSGGGYFSALWLYGLDGAALSGVHPDNDKQGKALEVSRLPTRVGAKRLTKDKHDF